MPHSASHDRLQQYDDVAIYVIDVGMVDPRNFALGDVKLASQSVSKNSRVRLEAELARTGPGEERAVGLYIVDRDGKPQKRAEQNLGWLDGQSLPAEFELRGLGLGTHQGLLKILGDDALDADNTRYFTVEVARPEKDSHCCPSLGHHHVA